MLFIIFMKSGAKFQVEIIDYQKFVTDVYNSIHPEATCNLWTDGDMTINVNDISAIYPKKADIPHR